MGAKGGHPLALLADYDYETCIVTRNVSEETGSAAEAYYYEAVIVG